MKYSPWEHNYLIHSKTNLINTDTSMNLEKTVKQRSLEPNVEVK